MFWCLEPSIHIISTCKVYFYLTQSVISNFPIEMNPKT